MHLLQIELTKFEQFLYTGKIFKKIISKIHALLLVEEESVDISQLRWQREIQREIPQEKWRATHRHCSFEQAENGVVMKTFCATVPMILQGN